MPGYIGALGKAAFGKFELGRGIYRRTGDRVTGAFEADGHSIVSWIGSMARSAAFTAAGVSTVSWLGSLRIGGVWECDGKCIVLWVGGAGSVMVTCIEASSGFAPSPPVNLQTLWDAPAAY